MPAIINLEEKIGKTVGKRVPPNDPFVAYRKLLRLSAGLARPVPYPKGVFRFKTHEEADAWQWNYIMMAATENKPTAFPEPEDPLANVPAWLKRLLGWLFRK